MYRRRFANIFSLVSLVSRNFTISLRLPCTLPIDIYFARWNGLVRLVQMSNPATFNFIAVRRLRMNFRIISTIHDKEKAVKASDAKCCTILALHKRLLDIYRDIVIIQ